MLYTTLNLFLGLVSTLILSLSVINEKRRRSPFIVFPAGIILFYNMPYFYYVFDFRETTGFFVGMWGVLFSFFYCVFRFYFSSVAGISWANKINKGFLAEAVKKDKVIMLFFLIMIMVSLFISLYSNFGFDLIRMLSTSWGERRLLSENEFAGAGILSLYLFLFSASAFLYSIFDIKNKKTLLFFCVLSLLYFMFVIKTRSYIIYLVLPIIIFHFLQEKINVKSIMKILLLCASLFAMYYLTRVFRHSGSILNMINNASLLADNYQSTDVGDFSLVRAFFYLVQNQIIIPGFNQDNGLLRIFMVLIPAGMSGGFKPEDMPYLIWDAYIGIKGIGGSYVATVVADSYFNNFEIGFLTYPLIYAASFTVIEKIILSTRGLWLPMFGVIAGASITMVRGQVSNGFTVLVCGLIFWSIIHFLLRSGK